jgi:hypothetical protein
VLRCVVTVHIKLNLFDLQLANKKNNRQSLEVHNMLFV